MFPSKFFVMRGKFPKIVLFLW